MYKKIAILGAGMVGASTARMLAWQQLAHEITLVDVEHGRAQGNATDLNHSLPVLGLNVRIRGGSEPDLLQGADVVVITAGYPRKKGMSRSDVLLSNVPIIHTCCLNIAQHAPDALVIVVSNPVDSLCYFAWQSLGWGRNRVFGLGGLLDSTRMASYMAQASDTSPGQCQGMVIGGHGDTMVPLPSYATIGQIPMTELLDEKKTEDVLLKTRIAGAKVVEQRGFTASEAPAAAVTRMLSATLMDKPSLLPVVAVLQGEYGFSAMAMTVPVMLGQNGVQSIVELPLGELDKNHLQVSAQQVQKDIATINNSHIACDLRLTHKAGPKAG